MTKRQSPRPWSAQSVRRRSGSPRQSPSIRQSQPARGVVLELSAYWRLQHGHAGEKREAIALRLVGVSFLILAAYVAFGAGWMLITHEPPEASLIGIVIACLSLSIMPQIARAKRRVAARLNSRALEADSRQTQLCAYLSAILLGGLALNAAFGWWWADPVAALIMVPIIAREGISALRGEACSECH